MYPMWYMATLASCCKIVVYPRCFFNNGYSACLIYFSVMFCTCRYTTEVTYYDSIDEWVDRRLIERASFDNWQTYPSGRYACVSLFDILMHDVR